MYGTARIFYASIYLHGEESIRKFSRSRIMTSDQLEHQVRNIQHDRIENYS